MKKVYIILLLLVMTISAGCGTGTTSSHNTEADIELDKPSVRKIIHWVKMYLILRAKRIHQTTVTIGL